MSSAMEGHICCLHMAFDKPRRVTAKETLGELLIHSFLFLSRALQDLRMLAPEFPTAIIPGARGLFSEGQEGD